MALSFSLLNLWSHNADAERPGCDDIEMAKRAEEETDNLKTWRQMYDWYRLYSACDDGTIAEGFSDKVVRELAHHWDQFPALQKLADENRKFGDFVIKHIDDTTDARDLDRVAESASEECPRGDERLCERIRRKATEAR